MRVKCLMNNAFEENTNLEKLFTIGKYYEASYTGAVNDVGGKEIFINTNTGGRTLVWMKDIFGIWFEEI